MDALQRISRNFILLEIHKNRGRHGVGVAGTLSELNRDIRWLSQWCVQADRRMVDKMIEFSGVRI